MKKQNQHALFSFIPFSNVETVASCSVPERLNLFSAKIVLLHHLGGRGCEVLGGDCGRSAAELR